MGHLSAPPHPRRTLVNYEGRRAGGTELTGATLSPGLVRPTSGQDSDQRGEGHHCGVYIRNAVEVHMSPARQCLRKGPGNFLGETKKAFRESCVVIGY